MPIGAFTRPEQGFEAFVLSNSSIALTVVPELGAKVISLKNLRTGREWMYHPPGGLRLFRNRPGDDFATSPMAGWDECLPTVAPCVWNGQSLPDHGEVWSAAWTWDRAAWRHGVLSTALRLAIAPFDFQRTVELVDRVVRVTYSLVNRGDRPEAFVWAMHPLLAIHDGDRLELPPDAAQLFAAEPWTGSLDFGDQQPACAKRFAAPLREGRAGVSNAHTGDRLTFHWDATVHGVLGLWLTRGGWHGHHHLALEPTNGTDDSLAVAAVRGAGQIGSRETRTWTVQLMLEP